MKEWVSPVTPYRSAQVQIGARALFQYKDHLPRYRDSHFKDKVAGRIPILVRWHLYIATAAKVTGDLQPDLLPLRKEAALRYGLITMRIIQNII